MSTEFSFEKEIFHRIVFKEEFFTEFSMKKEFFTKFTLKTSRTQAASIFHHETELFLRTAFKSLSHNQTRTLFF